MMWYEYLTDEEFDEFLNDLQQAEEDFYFIFFKMIE